MKFGPYSFEKDKGERSAMHGLRIPMIVAAVFSAGLAVFLAKKIRQTQDAEQKSEWNINWVELTDFKKPEAPKTKEQK